MSRTKLIPLVALAEVSGLVGVALMVTWMVKYLDGFAWDGYSKQFNLHPLLMTIAMVFFNGNALMFYRITVGVPVSRIVIKLTHASLQLLSLALAIIAIVAVFGFHNNAGIANMYSFHSWIGMSTFIMFGLQFVFGGIFFILFAYGWARTESLRAHYLPIHVFFGKIILIMATITVCVGIQEKAQFSMGGDYTTLPAQAVVAHVAGACFIIFTSTVMYIITDDSFKPVSSISTGYRRDLNSH